MIRILIIDDERLARRRIRRLLAHDPKIEVIGECSSGEEALPAIEEKRPDLLLLDVQMPGINGLEMLERLSRPLPAVIFTTAYDRYAVQAFDFHALDYVLKPIDEHRFHAALERAHQHLEHHESASDKRLLDLLADLRRERASLDRLMIKQPGRAFFIKTGSIDWLEASDNYVRIHAGGETHLIRDSMSALESKLDPKKFARIHRSTIVNIDRIREIQSLFQGNQVIVLVTGQKLRVGRNYREKLEAVIG